MKSQNDQILADLKRGRVITALTALRDYDCFRLAARIKNLRDAGYLIHTHICEDNGKRYAQYYMGAK